MEELTLFVQATGLSATAVLVITQLLKLVPVSFTSRYPAWVNGVLSVVAAVVVVKPTINLNDIPALIGTALLIAVTAAMAYNQFVKKLLSESAK